MSRWRGASKKEIGHLFLQADREELFDSLKSSHQ